MWYSSRSRDKQLLFESSKLGKAGYIMALSKQVKVRELKLVAIIDEFATKGDTLRLVKKGLEIVFLKDPFKILVFMPDKKTDLTCDDFFDIEEKLMNARATF